jgi:hypothetical protein
MNKIQEQCEELLKEAQIDINSEIDFDVNSKIHTLSFKYIIESFMQASEESQEVFLIALKKAVNTRNMGVDKFFEGMGQLLLMTHLSKKI